MPVQESPSMRELRAFVDRCHAAIAKQSQGHPGPFLELWSHADDVTIMAAIGGYQAGFDAVRELLTCARPWASALALKFGYSNATLDKIQFCLT